MIGSLSPGACPTSKTLLTTGPPLTTGLCMFGQSVHALNCSTCNESNRENLEVSATISDR